MKATVRRACSHDMSRSIRDAEHFYRDFKDFPEDDEESQKDEDDFEAGFTDDVWQG